MNEHELRRLAEQLRGELPRVIADRADRAAADAELSAALALPPEEGGVQLAVAIGARPATRAWMREHAPDRDDPDRIGELPGRQTAPLGVLFECPEGDEDFVRENVSDPVPVCSRHGTPMMRVDE